MNQTAFKKREIYHKLSEVTEQDLTTPNIYPDGCSLTTWYIDQHFPHPHNSQSFPKQEFRSLAYDDPDFDRLREQAETISGVEIPGSMTKISPYSIPYRCFYSRNVPNLMMAGRNISATHVAFGSTRTMIATGIMGTVVGRAAFLCMKHECDPREIYKTHLDDFKALLKNPDILTE